MSRRDPDSLAWTAAEDIFLSQGFVAFHDERTNQPDFLQIRERFPFHEDRKVSDLSDRWREITEHLDNDDQELIARMRASSKSHRAQTWTYKYEPQADLPQISDILEDYREMPSLSMKTQFLENSISKFTPEQRNVNEACLNHQFEASNVNHIVQEVLKNIVDDVPLRDTLSREFRNALARKGREFAAKDTIRKLEMMNEIRDHAIADQERLVMADYFERVLQSIQMKTSRPGAQETVLDDCLAGLAALAEISWPGRPSQAVDALQKDFKKRFVQTTMAFLRVQGGSPLLAPLLTKMTEIDRTMEFDAFFEQCRTHLMNWMKQRIGAI